MAVGLSFLKNFGLIEPKGEVNVKVSVNTLLSEYFNSSFCI